mmetsp:Transcript_114069/g.303228  ORF Transcript_114069/g.303228 Transcript_114069/m.303228 type:complete len:134 (-) Transcript_114069:629-1030(-)
MRSPGFDSGPFFGSECTAADAAGFDDDELGFAASRAPAPFPFLVPLLAGVAPDGGALAGWRGAAEAAVGAAADRRGRSGGGGPVLDDPRGGVRGRCPTRDGGGWASRALPLAAEVDTSLAEAERGLFRPLSPG